MYYTQEFLQLEHYYDNNTIRLATSRSVQAHCLRHALAILLYTDNNNPIKNITQLWANRAFPSCPGVFPCRYTCTLYLRAKLGKLNDKIVFLGVKLRTLWSQDPKALLALPEIHLHKQKMQVSRSRLVMSCETNCNFGTHFGFGVQNAPSRSEIRPCAQDKTGRKRTCRTCIREDLRREWQCKIKDAVKSGVGIFSDGVRD